jgi:hypothetical protein
VYDVDVEGTTYRVHVFTTTGNSSFTVSQNGPVEYLIVGGGGSGGGTRHAGGGGGGGLLTGTIAVTPQSYTIAVGAGGAGNFTPATSGSPSSAVGLTAIGGGGGADASNGQGMPGGSGGGASRFDGFALGTAGQGNNGGTGSAALNGQGAGGGGAGQIGGPALAGFPGGSGGNGLVSSLTGISQFYAAGGGGGGAPYRTGGTPGAGGLGGGGAGNNFSTPGVSGTPNTGGGGGGCGGSVSAPDTAGAPGGAGGSGIVIIRYPLRQANPVTAAGKVIGDGLLLDLDFAKPTVYSGSGTVVNDSRFNGLGGTITGTVPFLNFGTHRSAMRGNITAGNSIILNPRCIAPGNEISLVFWNFGKTQQQSSIIAGSTGSAQDLNIHLPWSDGNVYWDCGSPFNRISFNISAIYLGWRHWVFTHNANTGIKRIYNNGVEVSSGGAQTSSIPTLTSLRLGEYFTGSNYGHNGDIGLFSSYNREISATEISQLYNATRWRFGV